MVSRNRRRKYLNMSSKHCLKRHKINTVLHKHCIFEHFRQQLQIIGDMKYTSPAIREFVYYIFIWLLQTAIHQATLKSEKGRDVTKTVDIFNLFCFYQESCATCKLMKYDSFCTVLYKNFVHFVHVLRHIEGLVQNNCNSLYKMR